MKNVGDFLNKRVSRRNVLKGGVAVAGATAITGFPTVWAQNLKDVTLNHTGMSYSTLAEIGRQAEKDLGFKIEMSVVDHPGLLNRVANDPKSIDVADIEIWQNKVLIPQGVLQGIEIAKIKNWGDLTTLYTEGTFDGREVSRQGDAPIEFIYRKSQDDGQPSNAKTDWINFVPGVFNADTLGIRPDLVGRPITTWADLISPEFKGKAAIQNIPTNGIMDAMMAMESAGLFSYGDKGNPTQDELAATIGKLIELKKAGHFRALWSTFDESVNLMATGEVVIQSMWSPAVAAVQAQSIKCTYQPLREGYRGWGNGLCLLGHVDGLKRDAAYEYLNWYNSGWVGGFIAKQGYYSANPKTAMASLTDNERGFFYEGKAATADIVSPGGQKTNVAGDKRDGGSFADRFSKVAVWNNLMDEAEFLYAKWNEFNAA
ncbi:MULTISPECIES: PotD/PotF family extracellular solute-binding protein [unclassified Mesorhizobium]|uniref:ABC transporter substrate-binding protein n=1 Tax=unclassified Mesorhizobium TaxID=325217 RepID=UPI000FDC4232|nr:MULTISPECIES: PotD/PotF family extracellular solute-binding protein [unclassified Mesorhizobium]TGT71770.1 extracellular solute-binding protein [Mesorhizobium sp. M2E.F.Ca.ET.166.01.1.1]TGV99516.1 extracellular solute-binding protein [Mesorhizobium sp. M2E.F.Ca.ET.154.01.1.1]